MKFTSSCILAESSLIEIDYLSALLQLIVRELIVVIRRDRDYGRIKANSGYYGVIWGNVVNSY